MRVTQREAGREIIVYNMASARAALYSCAGPTSVLPALSSLQSSPLPSLFNAIRGIWGALAHPGGLEHSWNLKATAALWSSPQNLRCWNISQSVGTGTENCEFLWWVVWSVLIQSVHSSEVTRSECTEGSDVGEARLCVEVTICLGLTFGNHGVSSGRTTDPEEKHLLRCVALPSLPLSRDTLNRTGSGNRIPQSHRRSESVWPIWTRELISEKWLDIGECK